MRARSTAEFISKLEVALQELEETAYWLELLVESGCMPESRLGDLMKETDELTAIFETCVKNAKSKREAHPSSFRLHPSGVPIVGGTRCKFNSNPPSSKPCSPTDPTTTEPTRF
ncbi:MAG: four helix bundle protein [Planctomycetota bacterium]